MQNSKSLKLNEIMKKLRTSIHAVQHYCCMFKMVRIMKLMTLLLLMATVQVFAETNDVLSPMGNFAEEVAVFQPRTISGVVIDQRGQPLIGVSISAKGTSVGTITDVQGNYSLSDVPGDAILVFSYIGMLSQEIALGSQTTINVTMEIDAIGIEEVIAIGYGTLKKSDLTGSVATVGYDDIANRVVPRLDEALQGKMAGVTIQQTSGLPGAAPVIRIRGTSSITEGNQPLWVIDGMPVEDAEVIANLNMNDVESIEVLKDAASAAIYGSRGGNGVILVTTKRGRAGKPQITYNMHYGMQKAEKLLDLLTGPEHAEYEVERRSWLLDQNANFDQNTPNDDRPTNLRIDPNWVSGNVGNFDHQDEMFVTSPIQNHNLSISGGTDNTIYHMSMGYLDQEGVIKNSSFNRYSFRVNLESKIQERIKVGLSLAPSFSTQLDVNSEGKDQTITGMLLTPPTANLDDSYWDETTQSHRNDYTEYYGYGAGGAAVYYILNNLQQEYKRNQLLSSAFMDVTIANGLSFRSTVYYRLNLLKSNDYRDIKTGRGTRSAVLVNNYNSNLTWENTLNYTKVAGNHSINGLLGYSSQQDYFETTQIVGKGFASDARLTLNNASAITEWDQDIQEWSMISMFARASYNYDSRYLLSASIRRDGSSRFGAENKWGIFPAVSAAWRISEESFMDSQTIFSSLKLRGSFGATGNNRIGNYRPYASLLSSNAILGRGEATVIGLIPGSFENQALTWEKNQTTNIGLDMGILDNRVFVSVDAYNSVTKELLLDVPVPQTTGFYTAIQNIGEVSNKGIEMEIASRNITAADFTWNTSVVFSYNKNEVLAMGPDEAPIKNGDFWCRDCSYTGIGYPIGSFYLYETDGIFMTQGEVDASALYRNEGVGDVKWVDQNGDDVVDALDRTVLGQPSPKYNFGITNTLRYKGFDLNLFISGSGGHDTFFAWSRYISRPQVRVHTADFNDRWKSESEPGNGIIPRVTSNAATNGADEEHDRWLYDSSWWRIKNLTLGFNLPASSLQKLHIAAFRVYVSGDNLLLFTDYPGYNPEGGLKPMPGMGTTQTETPFNSRYGQKQSPSYNLGMDFGSSPLAKRFIVGVNITF